jgi:hypothetical protein
VVAEPPRRSLGPSRGTRRRRRRRTPLAAQAADIAGRTIAAAVPLHRLDPRVVNGAALLEILAFVLVVITASGVAFAALGVASVVFVGLHLADQRAVLAVQEDGEATILAAGRNGRPTAVRASTPHPPALPEPSGLAAALRLDGRRWWIDRGAYPLLVEARSATPPA